MFNARRYLHFAEVQAWHSKRSEVSSPLFITSPISIRPGCVCARMLAHSHGRHTDRPRVGMRNEKVDSSISHREKIPRSRLVQVRDSPCRSRVRVSSKVL